MKCTRVEKFLPLHVAGDLPERRGRAVEHHLAACEKCRLTADEYRASREMFCAATLSPDFEDAFYEEIRNSVLARIRRDRTLAPPFGFARFFDARLAFAASFALLLVAAALALHSYTRRTSEDGESARMIATLEPEPTAPPRTIESPQATRPESNDRPTPRPSRERARGTAGKERRAAKSSLSASRTNVESARREARPDSSSMPHAPSTASRNPPAPNVATTETANAEEMNAGNDNSGGATNAQPEVSRIEIQTSDPNIRIIWLSRGAVDPAQPLK